MQLCTVILESAIQSLFIRLGFFIGRRPVAIIAAVFLLTLICSFGMLRFEEINNVRTEYSPTSSPSRYEYAVAKRFMQQNGSIDPSYVMIRANDGGSLMRPKHRQQAYNLTTSMLAEVVVYRNGRPLNYMDVCAPYCEMTAPFLAFMRTLDRNSTAVTYPTLTIFGNQVFIGNSIYGVTLKNLSTNGGRNREIESFTTVILPFYVVFGDGDHNLALEWQLGARALFQSRQYDLINAEITGDNLVSVEVQRMGSETAPIIIGSIVAMIIFVVAFSFRHNSIRSKPWEALWGCIVPLLSLLSAVGLLSAIGLKFQSIVVATLFLVLAVGVDDVFIIMRAWDRTDHRRTVPERLSATLEDAGPSITISSLTNAMSFAIGITSSTPAVQTFCIYSTVAIVICYFYQLILFTAILALSGIREESGRQSLLCCFKANPDSTCSPVEVMSSMHDCIVHHWSRLITTWRARGVLAVFLCIYYVISYCGLLTLKSNISIERMALPNSYLHNFQDAFETALRNMQPISVFVMKPGNLSDAARLDRLRTMVTRYETAANSYGSDSTFFWLRPYEEFLRFYGIDNFTYTELPTFLKSASYNYYTGLLHLDEAACYAESPACIVNFMFVTNFHEVVKYDEMIPAVLDWRRIAAEYAEFDVYPYSDHAPFVDQTLSIDRTIVGNTIAALVCTAVACLIFIPNALSIVVAVGSVISISVGTFGILSHWGIDLDPLSMAALLMAIGFSVDYTAHMSFHYYKHNGVTPADRLEKALMSIGWPMLQVGLSTIVGLLPLVFKPSYLALVFLKTVVVVVLLGIFHGLVVLPAVLTALPCLDRPAPSSDSSSERSSHSDAITIPPHKATGFYKSQSLHATSGLGGNREKAATISRRSPICRVLSMRSRRIQPTKSLVCRSKSAGI